MVFREAPDGLTGLFLPPACKAIKRAEHKGFFFFYPDQYVLLQSGNKKRDKELGRLLSFSDV